MNRINLKMLTLIVLCLFVEMIHAQKITEWIGGASGREQDWFCNKNWTTQTVPNEFSTVIIKNRFTNKTFYPKIKCGIAKVWNLEMESSAELFIEKYAELWVMNSIQVKNKKYLHSKGKLLFLNSTSFARNNTQNVVKDVCSQLESTN